MRRRPVPVVVAAAALVAWTAAAVLPISLGVVTLGGAARVGGPALGAAAAGSPMALDRAARPDALPGELARVAAAIGADDLWAEGIDGRGVGVALVDSGVGPAAGLDTDAVIVGPDFTDDAGTARAHLDATGHGTHLAGIIAGRTLSGTGAIGDFTGLAPAAHIVSLKVVASDGTTDPRNVVEAVDWAVAHRVELNIRVLNLAYTTNQFAGWRVDPLEQAATRARNAGIVVVVAAGNDGGESPLRSPASSAATLVVGAVEADGTVAPFSSRGDAARRVDVMAPGRSIVSVVPRGSAPLREHPESVLEGVLIKATGTSQAAAVVSGAAALVVQAHPWMNPDEIRTALTASAPTTLDLSAAKLDSPAVSLAGAGETAEWHGQEWHGQEWHGQEWHGQEWHGQEWHGQEWR